MSLTNLVKNQYISNVQQLALTEIKKDRNRFKPVWDIVEDYSAKHNIIISSVASLLNKQDTLRNIYDKTYLLYTDNPLRHANQLTNLLHKQLNVAVTSDKDSAATNARDKDNTANVHDTNTHDSKLIRMKTIQDSEEFEIEYCLRLVVCIYKLQNLKTTHINTVIKPTKINGNLYMPAEIEVLDVLHQLYFLKDDALLEDEKQLMEQIAERKSKGIFGSGDCKEKRKEILESIKISLVLDWLPKQSNVILLGPWAYDLMQKKPLCANIEKIQLISTMDSKELLIELNKYFSEFGPFKITMREQQLNIPKDFRTTRVTYYFSFVSNRNNTEKPFLDLFNCAEFEIVPYCTVTYGHLGGCGCAVYKGGDMSKQIIDELEARDRVIKELEHPAEDSEVTQPKTHKKRSIKLASKFTMLRFLFIDLWVIRVVKNLKLIDTDVLNIKVEYLWKLIDYYQATDNKIEDVIGTYREYSIDKKLLKLSQTKRYFPYVPEIYYNENKEYRNI